MRKLNTLMMRRSQRDEASRRLVDDWRPAPLRHRALPFVSLHLHRKRLPPPLVLVPRPRCLRFYFDASAAGAVSSAPDAVAAAEACLVRRVGSCWHLGQHLRKLALRKIIRIYVFAICTSITSYCVFGVAGSVDSHREKFLCVNAAFPSKLKLLH